MMVFGSGFGFALMSDYVSNFGSLPLKSDKLEVERHSSVKNCHNLSASRAFMKMSVV